MVSIKIIITYLEQKEFKMDLAVKWFLVATFIVSMLSFGRQYFSFEVDALHMTLIAEQLKYEELEQKYKDATSTDGYAVPEADYLIFPFVPGPSIYVTSQFHLRSNPFEKNAGPSLPKEKIHTGIDIVDRKQNLVLSTVTGVVVGHWPPPNGYWKGDGAFGGKIIIKDLNGIYHSFSHLSDTYVSSVQGKNVIMAGDPIGRQGSTGSTTGAHLHYEIYSSPARDGSVIAGRTTWYDPIRYFDIRLDDNGRVLFPDGSQPLVIER